jgi:DNA modification methylase
MRDTEQKIIQGDCLEVMKTFEDKSFDLVLTDPPYGDGIGYGRLNKTIDNNEDESINYKVLPEIYRVLCGGGVAYLFTNWKFSGKLISFIEKNTEFFIRTQIVIVKNNIGMGYGFRNQYELCLVLEKGKHTYEKADFSNVQKMEHMKHNPNSHPHEKGVELLKRMIEHIQPSQNILDCFAGSGSTLIAAKQLNRNAVGIEISEKYCKLAEERLNAQESPMFV